MLFSAEYGAAVTSTGSDVRRLQGWARNTAAAAYRPQRSLTNAGVLLLRGTAPTNAASEAASWPAAAGVSRGSVHGGASGQARQRQQERSRSRREFATWLQLTAYNGYHTLHSHDEQAAYNG